MTIQIDLQSEPPFKQWKPAVLRACKAIIDQLGVEQGALTIVLTHNEKLRQMNLEFAGQDHSTDVLSFPSGELDPESGLPYLGDVLIAVPMAQAQANQKGNDLGAELSLLAIHGTLHLLGYDHTLQQDKDKMWSEQTKALQSLGMEDVIGEGEG